MILSFGADPVGVDPGTGPTKRVVALLRSGDWVLCVSWKLGSRPFGGNVSLSSLVVALERVKKVCVRGELGFQHFWNVLRLVMRSG